MFLQPAPDTPEARRIYDEDLKSRGYVMNLDRLWAWRPDVYEAFVALRMMLMKGSSLTKREFGVMVCATASQLGDSYCALAWGTNLAKDADAATAAAVLRASVSGGMSPRERALAEWARKVVRDPNGTGTREVEALRNAGLSDREIFEATTFVAFRLAFSSINDALGALPDPELAQAAPAEVREAVTFGRPVVARG